MKTILFAINATLFKQGGDVSGNSGSRPEETLRCNPVSIPEETAYRLLHRVQK